MRKNVRLFYLTPFEECVAQVLWDSDKPLSQQQILDAAEASGSFTWKARSIFSTINSLMDKGVVKTEGFVRSGKTYSRTFQATMTRPEYYAQLVKSALNEKELAAFKKALKNSNEPHSQE